MLKRLLLLLPLLASPTYAEDPMVSFAAAIAPEQAFEVCFMGDAVSAAECALAQCAKASGSDECIITSACGRGWSGAMGVITDEIHWTETVCGGHDEAAVVGALKAFCKAQEKHVKECIISTVWDDRGHEKKLDLSFDPNTLN